MKPKKIQPRKNLKALKKPWIPLDIVKVDNFILRIAKFKGKYHWHSQ